jgi:hypothetical protein
MPDEQLKIDTGEGEVPLAPPSSQNLDARTMESDLKSLQETGGQNVKSYTPTPTPSKEEPTSREQMFEPPSDIPPTGAAPTAVPPPTPLPKKKSKIGPVVAVTVLIIAAAAVGYFIVYPALVPSFIEEEIAPPVSESPPEVISPEQEPPIIPPAPSALNLPTIETHLSYFTSPADSVRQAVLVIADINSFHETVGPRTGQTPTFEEIVVENQNGRVIAFSGLMPLLAPAFFNPNVLGYFENDYTLYAYTNSQGTWLGVIAKLRNDVDVSAIQNQMSGFQRDPDNRNFFLADPGAMGVWRDGAIKDKPSSIVDFERNDATLSYAWFDKYLILSTNLNGAAEAATRLGF